jgi:hypothetical protein
MLLPRVYRVEETNTQKYLKDYHKECEHNSFWGLEVASEILGGITPLNTSKEDRK